MVAGLDQRYRGDAVSVVGRRAEQRRGSRVAGTIVIDAPPDEVWRVVADPRNLPRWNPHITDVHLVPEDGLKRGTTYHTHLRLAGTKIRVDAEVIDIEAGRFSEIELSGPVSATVRTFLHPIGRHQTRVDHEVQYRFPGGPIGGVVARAVRILGAPTLLRRGLRAQKAQVEEG